MNDITWFQKARLKAIETLSFWRGRINTRDVMETFGVSRVIALGDIHRYIELAPDNLVYQGSDKAFLVTPSFSNQLTSGKIDEWMKLNSNLCENVLRPQFEIKPDIARPIIDAIKKEHGLIIQYRSMSHPEGTERHLFPHTLVFSGFRWHIRAWCSQRKEFRDFNLSRITNTTPSHTKSPDESLQQEDSLWSKQVNIHLKANPKMSKLERSLIENEFNMINHKLIITTRAALVMYTLQSYQVTPSDKDNTYNQRLVLSNFSEIADHLWET